MYDIYGSKQVYLVQPEKVDYVIPKSDPLDTKYLGTFYTYKTMSGLLVESGIRIQMTINDATKFAARNKLIEILDRTVYQMLDKFNSLNGKMSSSQREKIILKTIRAAKQKRFQETEKFLLDSFNIK